MTLGLFESQDDILLHILFSDYYLIYSFFDKPIFPKHRNIGTVFLPTVLSSIDPHAPPPYSQDTHGLQKCEFPGVSYKL